MKHPEYLKRSWPFFLLLLADILLIVLHIINYFRPFENSNAYSLVRSGTYAEPYQNIKWLIMVICTTIVFIRKKETGYIAWIAIFIFLLLEDIFRLHESIGLYISNMLFPEGNLTLRERKIIELCVAGVIGVLLVAPVIKAYKKGSVAFKKHSADLLLLLIILVFFGIVVDQIDRLSIVKYNWKPRFIFNIIEDGGEMLAASGLAAYTIAMAGAYSKQHK